MLTAEPICQDLEKSDIYLIVAWTEGKSLDHPPKIAGVFSIAPFSLSALLPFGQDPPLYPLRSNYTMFYYA